MYFLLIVKYARALLVAAAVVLANWQSLLLQRFVEFGPRTSSLACIMTTTRQQRVLLSENCCQNAFVSKWLITCLHSNKSWQRFYGVTSRVLFQQKNGRPLLKVADRCLPMKLDPMGSMTDANNPGHMGRHVMAITISFSACIKKGRRRCNINCIIMLSIWHRC